MRQRKKHYRWSLRLFTKNILLLLLISGLALIMITTAAKATLDNQPYRTIEIRIMRGDTLWSIAQKIEPDRDPRLVIQGIKECNQLVSSNLEIGQSLACELPR